MIVEPDLLQRAVAGDGDALERLLVGVHAPLRSRLAERVPAILRSTISVDDLLQEVYCIVFQQIRTFEPRGMAAFEGWIGRIAETRLLDLIKAAAADKRGGGQLPMTPPGEDGVADAARWLELLLADEHTPSRDAGAAEAALLVSRALDNLPPDQRTALRLRYLEGLSVADAAVRLSRSEGAVCLLCHRGLEGLRTALGSSAQFFLSRP